MPMRRRECVGGMCCRCTVNSLMKFQHKRQVYHVPHHDEFLEVLYGCFQKSGENPQIILFNRVFHYKPSILGYPYFWKHQYIYIYIYSIAFVLFIDDWRRCYFHFRRNWHFTLLTCLHRCWVMSIWKRSPRTWFNKLLATSREERFVKMFWAPFYSSWNCMYVCWFNDLRTNNY